MPNEIKIGEYIRTKKGKIFKYGKGRAYLGKDNQIVKHSKKTNRFNRRRRLCKWKKSKNEL